MKKIKLIGCALLLLCLAGPARAQLKGFSIGGYLEAASPTAGFEDTHKNGVGLGVEGNLKLPGKWGLTASAGYMHFGARRGQGMDDTLRMPAFNATPLRVGVKYRLPLVYLKLESGVARFSRNGGTAFILSPGIGVRILALDIQGKLEAWTNDETYTFWGLKVGLHF
ncbi:MAG TPA: outer membrane beta-barrel protein [Chitinophagaceae bacterium]|nr:outer membrane beta-barrel protein [Chitinophagaceae bacterium]